MESVGGGGRWSEGGGHSGIGGGAEGRYFIGKIVSSAKLALEVLGIE
jgi:hypothetical protein